MWGVGETSIGQTQLMKTTGIMKVIMVIMIKMAKMPSRARLIFPAARSPALSSPGLRCVPATLRPSPSSSFPSHHFTFPSKRVSLVFTSHRCLQCLSHVTRRFLGDNLEPTKHMSPRLIISCVNIKPTAASPSWSPPPYCRRVEGAARSIMIYSCLTGARPDNDKWRTQNEGTNKTLR